MTSFWRDGLVFRKMERFRVSPFFRKATFFGLS
ncbi:hypothetical protein MSKU3_0591 [Komagataeibacter oboediens]|nr:hypothetical protein MSKU3_0591 [Komagataeibacter oboediens]